jgi:DNA-binding CsgD family transcriptional regulator/GAF domain-containing protein
MSGGILSGDDKVLDLVGAIYDAALDAKLWPGVLNRIGDAVGGPEVMFGVYDPTTGLSNLLAPRIDPTLVDSLLDWAPRNPLLPFGIGQPPGKVFTCGDFLTQDAFTGTAFYNEWWHPAGYDTEPLTTNLLADEGAAGLFSSYRSLKRSPFDSGQKAQFAALAQHLVRAVALQRRLYRLTLTSESALAGFDQLQQGFVLVDAQARPMFVNRVARALLDAGDGLRLDAGALWASEAHGGRALRAIIAGCAVMANVTIGGELTLRRGPGQLPLDLLVVPVQPEAAEKLIPWPTAQHAVAIVLVSDPQAEMRSKVGRWRQQFGFTPAEANFAFEIAKGDGRQAAAARVGITVGTARGYLSSIFDKTGVRHQAELVRMLLQTRRREHS